jgi:hypothetical protein
VIYFQGIRAELEPGLVWWWSRANVGLTYWSAVVVIAGLGLLLIGTKRKIGIALLLGTLAGLSIFATCTIALNGWSLV